MRKRDMIDELIRNKEEQLRYLKSNINMYEFFFDVKQIRKMTEEEVAMELESSQADMEDEKQQYEFMKEVVFPKKEYEDISLCTICHCMTKNIVDDMMSSVYCGKCQSFKFELELNKTKRQKNDN